VLLKMRLARIALCKATGLVEPLAPVICV